MEEKENCQESFIINHRLTLVVANVEKKKKKKKKILLQRW
jgi:hypothetical protein